MRLLCFAALLAVILGRQSAEPIPDRLVVLTFDDSVASQATFVAPLLKKHGFGATFFITEGFEFLTDKEHHLTWEQIKALHAAGFEIGNQLLSSGHVSDLKGKLAAGLTVEQGYAPGRTVRRESSAPSGRHTARSTACASSRCSAG
jgi:peptidoglycan/xylan/chitin deacetylase (PgdA/CDA1 family)